MVNDWNFTECVKYQMAEEQRGEMEGRIEELPRMQPRQKSAQRQKEMKLKGLRNKKLQ